MRRLIQWLMCFFTKAESPAAAPASPPDAPELVATPVPAAKRSRRPQGPDLRIDVLDQLEHYMRYIKRMRKRDPDAYALYAKVGAQIVPDNIDFDRETLAPWFRQALPSFGAVAHVGSRHDDLDAAEDRLSPRFSYFSKMARPPHTVQQINRGTLYMMTAFFADAKKPAISVPVQIPILLDDDAVRPLLIVVNQPQTLRHKRPGEAGQTSTVQHMRWGVPPMLRDWASQHNKTPVEMARCLFYDLANQYTQTANSMIRVEAKKGGVSALFDVDVLKTPEFFSGREKVKTARGRTVPIFHIVRAHTRTLKNGKVLPIKTHFAGLSNFVWADYVIKITVPGKHHASLADAKFGHYPVETISPRELNDREWLNNEQAAEMMSSAMVRK